MSSKFKQPLILLIILCFTSISSFGQQIPADASVQDLSSLDLGSIQVDQLTDSQLKAYMRRAEQSGLSQSEIEAALQMRGLPQSEISKLKQRLYSINSGIEPAGSGYEKVRKRQPKAEGDLFDALKMTPEEFEISEIERRLFGFSLFNSQNLTFDPSLNIPTPQNYQLGSGDEIIIDVWGASEQTYQQIISPDGYIIIPNIGPIFLNGLDINRANSRIKSRLSKIYSGINPQDGSKPNTFIQVSLGQIRTIKINLIGEVRRPGTYDISALATVFNALYLSGGPSINGSFREIELIRNNKIKTVLDLYDFLIEGIQENNIQLEDQDIIRIKPFNNRVEVVGEVKRDGIFEGKKGEKVSDLIRFAGGFTENAYTDLIKLRRNTGKQRKLVDVSNENFNNTSIKNGDYLIVNAILDRFENRVQISGAVFREGEFELTEGLTLLKLIEKADGLTGDAYLQRGTILRTNDDFSTEAIGFNLVELIKGEESDLPIKREDFVKITSIYDLREEYYVSIGGMVRDPGSFPFMEGMTVEDLLLQAGGILESADISAVEVARKVRDETNPGNSGQVAEIYNFSLNEDLSIKNEEERFVLKPFDNVYIRKSPSYQSSQKIKIEGEVLRPGEYIISNKDERISDMIKRAGGITKEGYIRGATLIRRTEFYEPQSEVEKRYQDLLEIQKQLQEKYKNSDDLTLTESEYLRNLRMADLNKRAENYYNREATESSREGSRQKRRRIEQLSQQDTTLAEITFNKYETIGINLEKILEQPASKYDLIIQEGDIISVPRQLETVRLRGEFLYPITVRYDEKLKFKDYISQAGGFTDDAKKKKTYVIYANGAVDRTKKGFLWINNYPKLEPGAEIIVPAKPQRQPMSVQAWMALSTSIATLALVVQNLIK